MKKTNKLILISAFAFAFSGLALAACDEALSVGEHEHLYGPWTVTQAATCTENGMRVHTCFLCRQADEEEIPALGHDYDGGRETTAATCTKKGERTQTCRRCGITQTAEIPMSEHNWGQGVVLVQATCLQEGSMRLTCADCGFSDTVSLGFGAHDPVETERVEAKCETEGKISYRCALCGKTLDDVILPALAHRWKLGAQDVEPTCTEPGYRDRVCERCGKPVREPIAELGHALNETFTVDEPPTFEQTGLKSQHCIRCGAHVNVTVIPKLEENTPIEYEFRLQRSNGKLLSAPSAEISVWNGGELVTKSTPSTLVNGVFRASLLPKEYSVTVSGLPLGYSAAPATALPGDPTCKILLTAAPIPGSAPAGTRYSVGSVMYDFNFPAAVTSDGKSYSLSALLKEKKAVVLNFWATWCGPCQSEFPLLERVYRQVKSDIEILAVDQSTSDDLQSVKQFASSAGVSFPMVYDTALRLQSMFGVTDIPVTVVIDSEGVVSEIHSGALTDTDSFHALLAPYLGNGADASAAAALSGEACVLPEKRPAE